MIAFASKARALLTSYYAMMVEYRSELMVWGIAVGLPLIMMGVWIEAGATGLFPLDNIQLMRYFIAIFLVRQLTVAWVIYEFEYHVVTGRLSPRLLQPIDPGWHFVAMHLGEQFARVPLIAAIFVTLLLLIFPEALWGAADDPDLWLPSWWRILLAFIFCYAAFALRFLMQYSLALLAFWIERVSSIEGLIYVLFIFLSGMMAPMEMFEADPLLAGILAVNMYLPFPYMAWFPAQLLAGGEVPILKGALVVAGWMVVLYLLNRWLWRRGLRHYAAMGA